MHVNIIHKSSTVHDMLYKFYVRLTLLLIHHEFFSVHAYKILCTYNKWKLEFENEDVIAKVLAISVFN